MILIDPREGGKIARPGQLMPSDQLVRFIRGQGIPSDKSMLEFGDAAFEGNLSGGPGLIGIERKTLHDLINCIRDGRFNRQRVGMMGKMGMYKRSFLIVEGHWKPRDPDGLVVMEGFSGGTNWGYLRHLSKQVGYTEIYNYLLSVSETGVTVTYSRDLFHTAINCCSIYRYYQKPWNRHQSMLEVYKPSIPMLDGKAKLVRKWASAIEEVGAIKAAEAERIFKTPLMLALSDEEQWIQMSGVGMPTARKIINQIQGRI